jgi:hypothetical protein
MDNILIVYRFDRMDFVKVTEMLSKSHWSPGIKIIERCLSVALNHQGCAWSL